MAHHIKNDDGTVNMEGLKSHLDFVKGKYAQNAKNYEANTGKKMSFGGTSTEEVKGEMKAKEDEPTITEKAKEASS